MPPTSRHIFCEFFFIAGCSLFSGFLPITADVLALSIVVRAGAWWGLKAGDAEAEEWELLRVWHENLENQEGSAC